MSRGVAFVVDDDPSAATVVAALLRVAGYEVESFRRANGLVLAARQRRPSLMLVDVNMPGLDGPALVRAVKSDVMLSHVRFLLVSSMDEHALAATAAACGAHGWLRKGPPTEMETALRRQLAADRGRTAAETPRGER